ncbi:MAG TPA: hypothetical protein VGC42_04100, partial [Kofleriaceae bacterium]
MSRRTAALVCIWTLPSAILLAVTAIIYSTFRIPPPDRLDAATRAAVIAQLRVALADPSQPVPPGPPAPDALHRPLAGPMAVTVWAKGRSVARVDATGPDLATATADAVRQLRGARGLAPLDDAARAAARLQVDLVVGHAPLAGGNWLFDKLAIPGIGDMLAINPGVEGIGAELGDKRGLLLPHELVAAKLLAAKRPSDAMPDFAMGVDMTRIG